MPQNILVVDDDRSILELLRFYLETQGYTVFTTENSTEEIKKVCEHNMELAVIDIMLPEINGIELCEILRKNINTKNMPIIFLTAKSSEEDKVSGLDKGADDYITKPFSMKELNARIKAVLRRNNNLSGEEVLSVYNLKINEDKHTVLINNREITFALKEYDLLKMLLRNKNKVLSRNEILDKVWGYDYFGETRTVDVHIRNIRKKINEIDPDHDYIETVRGVGYRIIE